MKPRLILLNFVLLMAIGASLWEGRARWRSAQAQRRATVGFALPRAEAPKVAPVPLPEAPQAVKYVDVATGDLFSSDRNPTVILEPARTEKPREMPSLPVVYGVLGLPSGVKALMAEKPGLSAKAVHVGDTVGEFRIAALDPRNVTFVWEDKEVRRAIDDLMDRGAQSGAAQSGSSANVPPPPPSANAGQQVLNPPLSPSSVLGTEVGAPGHSERACTAGDASPAGAVVDGYKKVLTATPFGMNCRWLPVQ